MVTVESKVAMAASYADDRVCTQPLGGRPAPARLPARSRSAASLGVARVPWKGTVSVEYARGVDAPPAVELAWSRGAGAETCIEAVELAGQGRGHARPARLSRARLSCLGRRRTGALRRASGDDEPLRLEGQVQALGSGGCRCRRSGGRPALRREVRLDSPDRRQFDEGAGAGRRAHGGGRAAERSAADPFRRAARRRLIGIGRTWRWPRDAPCVSVGFGLDTEVALPPSWHLAAGRMPGRSPRGARRRLRRRGARGRSARDRALGPRRMRPASFFGCVGAPGGVVYASGVGSTVLHERARVPAGRALARARGCESPARCSPTRGRRRAANRPRFLPIHSMPTASYTACSGRPPSCRSAAWESSFARPRAGRSETAGGRALFRREMGPRSSSEDLRVDAERRPPPSAVTDGD